MKRTIQKNQSILDLAIQYCGSSDSLIELANLNGIGITDIVDPGISLFIPEVADQRVFKFYQEGGYKPITIIPDDEELSGEGIEFWGIEYDFIVN